MFSLILFSSIIFKSTNHFLVLTFKVPAKSNCLPEITLKVFKIIITDPKGDDGHKKVTRIILKSICSLLPSESNIISYEYG